MTKVKETYHMSYNSRVEDAFVAEKIGRMMKFRKSNKGRPSMKYLANMIKINLILKSSVSLEDIKIAAKIYGKDLGSLMGKTTKRKLARVMTDTINLPREIKEMHNKSTIAADLIMMLMDSKFSLLASALANLGIELNITSRSEHVPEIKQ
eukprot:14698462-Ditylum_brightwellii.AAC.1